MITRECDYAMRALLHLAQAAPGETVPASDLAAAMEIPYRFLRGLARKLVAARLLRAKRGTGGGLALAKPPRQISLLDVAHAIDPRALTLNRCLLPKHPCSRARRCSVHRALAGLQRRVASEFAGVTFDRLAKE